MTKAQIMEYLGICMDMEKNIYAQQNYIDELKKERDSLRYITADPVEKQLKAIPVEPYRYTSAGDDNHGLILGIAIIAVALLSNVIWGICEWYSANVSMLYMALIFPVTLVVLVMYAISWVVMKIRFIAVAVGAVILLGSLIVKNFAKGKQAKSNKAEMERWQKEKREIEAYNRAEEKRVADLVTANEQAAWVENTKIWARWNALTQQAETAQKHLERSRHNLEEIYSKDIVYKKYRTLAGVSTIYEYFESGRCDDFKEAYNKLEEELRLDKIVLNLEQINSKLDSINRNQYLLYNVLQESNSIQRQMLSESRSFSERFADYCKGQQLTQEEMQQKLAGISASSQQTAYYAGQSAKELNYMNRMNYLSGNYSNYYDNSRP